MIIIPFVIILIICIFSVVARCAFTHPRKTLKYGFKDIFYYFKHKKYNNYKTGELVCYCGLFGKGKTLSVVHRVTSVYNHYNGLMVWDSRRKKMVKQEVRVISNVSLSIPYEDFISLDQIIYACTHKDEYDDKNDCYSIILVLGDEFSVQMNSRNFKSNINPQLLNSILTCRHYQMSIYYTSQKFHHVDALLRQVTQQVVQCEKKWRFQVLRAYDPDDCENTNNFAMINPIGISCWFVTDQDYNNYDTLACVNNLKRASDTGDMLSEEEILKLQMNTEQADSSNITNLSKKYRKSRKKLK